MSSFLGTRVSVDIKSLKLPLQDVNSIVVGDCILVSGKVFAGRDAVLPQVCALIHEGRLGELDASFAGNALLHTAVSPAGIGPTSSNKIEIEDSFPDMCKAGIKVFLGKGALSSDVVHVLNEAGAIFAVVPPVTALLDKGLFSKRLVAFPELGMEALWELEVIDCPAIVAIAHGESIF
jgi:fumarate hydratase subunit beta